MKKNISINISGIIFHIEEDGYSRLNEYLESINKYFSSFDDSSEIIADIEGRIAEIFLGKLKDSNREVVTSEDVESVITTMGTVADFQAVEEEPEGPSREAAAEEETSTHGAQREKPSRLYRDMKRRVLGGVASGIAHYFRIDPLWIRLIIIILFFNIFLGFGLSGLILLGYIIMWIVVPGTDSLEDDKKIKKMYRDPEHKVLGGVASGLAVYFGTDITVVRLLFVLSIFLGGSGLIIYIILWIITPEALSITEKMQMQGEPVTLSNIESSVKDRLNVKEDQDESPLVKVLLLPFRLIATLFKALSELLGPAMKFFLEALRVVVAIAIILAGLGMIFCLIVLMGIFFGIFTGFAGWVTVHDLPYEVFYGTIPTFGMIALFICVFVPALAIGLLGFTILFKTPITNSYVGWALFGLWIFGLIAAGLTLPNTIAEFRRSGEVSVTKNYDLGGHRAILKLNEVGMDDYSGVNLTLRGHRDSVFTLVTDYEARGRSRQQAQENARMAEYNVKRQDSILTFDSNITFKNEASFRFQEIAMVLYVPQGEIFYMEDDLEYILRNTIHRYGYSVHDIADNQWMFTKSGLECVTCEGRRSKRGRTYDNEEEEEQQSRRSPSRAEANSSEILTFDFEDFDEISASSKFDITITKGRTFDVELFGREKELDYVRLKQYGDVLELDTRDWKLFGLSKWKPIRVKLTMPELSKIKLSGACSAEAAGFSGDRIDIDLSGASDADLNLDFDEINIELSGSADLIIAGSADDLIVDMSGTSSLNALSLESKNADVTTGGVSSAKVFATRLLEVQANGASSVKYKGDPRLDIDEGRASSVTRY